MRWRLTLTDLWRRTTFTGTDVAHAPRTPSPTSPAGSTTALVEATRQFQLALEHHRAQDDGDSRAELEDAERHVSVLWLRHITGTTGVTK